MSWTCHHVIYMNIYIMEKHTVALIGSQCNGHSCVSQAIFWAFKCFILASIIVSLCSLS
jgi:uncharacterized membrane protein